MEQAVINNIQKFSVHDGPGIRSTVFFKGCPLRCEWCHNPGTQQFHIQMLYDEPKCVRCMKCLEICPVQAITFEQGMIVTDEAKCNQCGLCVEVCLPQARAILGRRMSVQDVLQEVLKDEVFYRHSGGGVTLSGGEPLSQPAFVLELLRELKDHGLHTAVDTSGAVAYQIFEQILPYTDVFLYDLKAIDPAVHEHWTAYKNERILENLKKLSQAGATLYIRIPIIEGVNADDDSIKAFLDTLKGIRLTQVNLLPYHDFSRHKYHKMGRAYKDESMKVPSSERMLQIQKQFIAQGHTTYIGG